MTRIDSLFRSVEDILSPQGILTQPLPILPKNVMEWMAQAIPYIGKNKRNVDLYAYWIDIYEDNHPKISIHGGIPFKS